MARILLVDDDTDIQLLGKALLGRAGHEVKVCSLVTEAIEVLPSQSFDLIISDASMPQFSGFDFLLTLKRDERYAKIPVIMMTGKKDRVDIERAIQMGVQDYIIKPVNPELLISKVQTILDKSMGVSREGTLSKNFNFRSDLTLKGFIQLPMQILKLTEQGLVIESSQFIDEGRQTTLQCELFETLGISQQPLRVVSNVPFEKNGQEFWTLTLSFVNLQESTRLKIKEWLTYSSMNLKEAA